MKERMTNNVGAYEYDNIDYEAYTRMDFGGHVSVDAMMAYELNQMTFHERDTIAEEIHGIRLPQSPNETPEMLGNSLHLLAVELESLPSKQAYDASQAFPQTYINTDDFRLIFLRREFFDAHKAAVRMATYLDLIHWAFGEKVLERDICISDFDETSAKFLRMGIHQVLPGRDRSGRRVAGVFINSNNEAATRKDRVASALYCMIQIARNDVSVQRRGIVGLYWTHNLTFDDLATPAWVKSVVTAASPVRCSAIHSCRNTDNNLALMATVMQTLSIGPNNRKRLRVHVGSATECLYKLQTFGIQSIQMPINTNTGMIKTLNHHKWLELQRNRDQAMQGNQPFNGIECPDQQDILFGRGWPKMGHPGNALFRSAIEARFEEYNTAKSKPDKTKIARSIVCEISDSGARFLREDTTGWWVEVSNDVARQKVSIGFRDIRKARHKSSKANNGEGNPSAQGTKNDALARPSSNNALAQVPPAESSKRKVPNPDSKVGADTLGVSSAATNLSAAVGDEDTSLSFLDMDGSKRQRCKCRPGGDNSEARQTY